MLKLVLTQGYYFNTNDFGRQYTFKIYQEDDTPFDATTYNPPIIKIFGQDGNDAVQPINGSWTVQNQGTGTFSFTQAIHLTMAGPHYIEVQLEKSGTVVSTERRKIAVMASP